MKKLYFLLLVLFMISGVKAQISITQNDMPHPGDTARYTTAAQNLLLNYTATGPNHTWDFRNLRAASQGLEQYVTPFSTNPIFGIFFLNLPFNTNRATVASNTTELPTSALVPLTNPYNFYYLNATQFSQTGFGSEISNIPLPVAFNNKDIIYKLPIAFGNTDTSNSDWNLGLANVGYMGYTQTRINNVDGWGTIRTPFGDFDVLRVKTTRLQSDTISINPLNLSIPRAEVNEYKWLANGEIFPILKITTQSFFGLELITDIKFRDDYIKVETNPLSSVSICAGSSVNVPFTKFGTFNPSTLFAQGNVFTAQLSDSSGSFANPVNIGTLAGNQSGNINTTIPANTIPGTHYRIRVISSNLPVIGSDNGIDITILNGPPVINGITTSGSLQFCYGGSVTLMTDQDPAYTYQWIKDGSVISGASGDTYIASEAGEYYVSVRNACGTVDAGVVNVIVDSLPDLSISNSTPGSYCIGDIVTLISSSTNASSYQWQIDGNPITGETNPALQVSQNGEYTLVAINNCGSTISTGITLLFNELPQINNISSSANGICNGDSVLLSGYVMFASSVQWQLNGTDITGAMDTMLWVNQSGDYTLVATNTCSTVTSVILTISINLPPQEPVINASNDTLYSTTALAYQWKFDGQIIIGANSQWYVPTVNGVYTVVITDINGCTSESQEFGVLLSGIPSVQKADIRIYPNPVSGNNLTIELPETILLTGIAIENILGQQIKYVVLNEVNGKINIMVDDLSAGFYSIRCITTKGDFKSLFIKQ